MTLPSRTPPTHDRFVWAYSPSRSSRGGREKIHALRPLDAKTAERLGGPLPRLALCGKGPDDAAEWRTDKTEVDARVACGRCSSLFKENVRRFGEPS